MSDLSDLPQAEAIVIARAVATNGEFLDDVELSADDFLTNEAAWAYDTINRMRAKGTPIDQMTVGMEDSRVEQYVWRVIELPTYAAAFHADQVHKAAVRRRMKAVATMIAESAGSMEVDDLLDTARRQIEDAAGQRRQSVVYVGDMIDEIVADAERPRLVYPSPWEGLDPILGGGFRPGALYTLAARPGIGKSAVALQIATALADAGPVAFSSLEMPREELVRRVVSQGAQLPHHLLERGEPMPELWKARIESWQTTAPHSIAIDDRSTVMVGDVRAFARAVRRPSGRIAGIIVDYLQLMGGPSRASRIDVVTENSRMMKIIAREYECPVIMLSQLNRNSEQRMDRRPVLSDLRDSGAIEQDSDVVLMLYRDPDFEQAEPGTPPLPVPLELAIAKNRHGPTAVHTLTWEGSQMRAY